MFTRLIAMATLAIATSACATKPAQVDTPGCSQMECVAIGEAAQLSDLLIATPLEVTEDSRCPAEADCIWEGRVVLKTRLDLGHETITVLLDSSEPMRINGGMLSLGEVAPYASTQWSPIEPGNYRFGFSFVPDVMEQVPNN